jgi:hypothetical protein
VSARNFVEIVRFDDWVRVLLDGRVFYEGHSMPDHEWIRLFQKLAPRVEFVTRDATRAETIEAVGYDPDEDP